MRHIKRAILKLLVAIAGFLVSTSLYKWLSAYQEAVICVIFNEDTFEDSLMSDQARRWCSRIRGLKK